MIKVTYRRKNAIGGQLTVSEAIMAGSTVVDSHDAEAVVESLHPGPQAEVCVCVGGSGGVSF